MFIEMFSTILAASQDKCSILLRAPILKRDMNMFTRKMSQSLSLNYPTLNYPSLGFILTYYRCSNLICI